MTIEPSSSDTGFASDSSVKQALAALSSQMEKGTLLLGLDRDGTLVPIADRPEQAVIDPAVVESLRLIGTSGKVCLAVVSARSLAQLRGDFAGVKTILGGNYGMEIQYTQSQTEVQPTAAQAVERLKQIRDELAAYTSTDFNAVLEDHGYSLCLHWHTVPIERRAELADGIQVLQGKYNDLRFNSLRTSYEMVPPFDWDKARALSDIEKHLHNSGRAPGGYCYFGDSNADEPAFAWVNARNGVSVRVGSPGASGESKLQLRDTSDVHQLLQQLAKSLS
jgi:trehalose 6-phosphate phosphatase